MRYSPEHKARTQERIVKEAARRFRRDGVAATGLQPLMKALGLTHGGFYAHFKSKHELVETALQQAACELVESSRPLFEADEPLRSFIARYLSVAHRDDPANGCPLPTISAELGQRGQPSVATDEMVQQLLAAIERCLDGDDAAERSVLTLCALVGALQLSRSVQDPELSARLLEATRASLAPAAEPAVPQPPVAR